jgi:hypothetical protein
MAIAIKTVPVLKEEAALKFNSAAEASIAQKSSIKFSKQIAISTKI